MKGEIISIETAKKMTEQEKELERLKRERNLYKLDNDSQLKKLIKLEQENTYLKKREKTLIALEKSIPQRIEKYKKQKNANNVIRELLFWHDVLSMEKEKILNKEAEENEKI